MLNTILIVLLIITVYASIRSILKNKVKDITGCGMCSSCAWKNSRQKQCMKSVVITNDGKSAEDIVRKQCRHRGKG